MSDLTDLPAELLDEVLSLAFGVAPRYKEGFDDEGALDIRSLSRLLLVNRKHHQAFLPLVYSHWTYNGARHSYSRLWKFLRTAVRSPDLASTVQVLNIGNWGVYPSFYLDRHRELQDQDARLQFTLDDEETVKIALQRAQVSEDLSSQIFDAVFTDGGDYQNRDRRPLMALLLTCLPCVWKVYAHVPSSDPFLGAILQAALGRRQSSSEKQSAWLPGLKEFHLLSEAPGHFEGSPKLPDDDIDHPSLKLDFIWPIFYLKGLHTIRLYDLELDGFSELFQQKIQGNGYGYECYIEHLHIVTKRNSICRMEDVNLLLNLPTALRSLSFSWDNDKAKTKEKINGKKRNVWQISNNEVWTAILRYKETLEYLDVFHDFLSEPRKHRHTDYFGPLTEFVQLRFLSIRAEMLIGGYVESVTQFRLKEALPASIKTLVFVAEEAGKTVPDLPLQIEEVVLQFPHLTTLQVTDAWTVNRFTPRGVTPAEYQSLQEACLRSGVRFRIEHICVFQHELQHCPFPMGARCRSRWKETYNMRIDAHFRYSEMRRRASRKAAGDRETPSPEPPERDFGFIEIHVLPFTDHDGSPSFMVFESQEDILLPPLTHLSIYFTHPDGPLPGAEDLEDDLQAMLAQIRTDGFDDDIYRLEVYFLPNASNEDCITHYQAERATRENSKDMLLEAKIRLNTDFPPPDTLRLPGMFETYEDSGYNIALFVHPDRSWRDGAQHMCFVHDSLGDGPEQSFAERWYGNGHPTDQSLGEFVCEITREYWHDTYDIYQDAAERGWITW